MTPVVTPLIEPAFAALCGCWAGIWIAYECVLRVHRWVRRKWPQNKWWPRQQNDNVWLW
jgi:hypothetical protein